MTKYISGAEAVEQGIISEKEWQLAIAHPWTWVRITPTSRIREIPWQGLEIETGVSPDAWGVLGPHQRQEAR